ncbi:MAG: hypothetical protein CMJ78_19045 [Planctomycetaceae bacterium]|nr:hypothetical protein [Planctomycetaceae bacterium]
MRSPRISSLIVCSIALVYFCCNQLPAEQPTVDNASAVKLASFQLPTSQSIQLFQKRVDQAPTDYLSRSLLGQLHLRHARETGDLLSYKRAETELQAALDVNPRHIGARSHLAQVYAAQHRFREALDIASQIYDDDFDNLTALATMGDAYLELGNYKLAKRSFDLLFEQVQSPPVLSRLAHFAELEGKNTRAIELMQSAIDAAENEGISKTELAWYDWRLGDLYFHTGDLKRARSHYQASLKRNPRYHIAVNGLADVAAARGQIHEALGHLQASLALRQSPGTHAELAGLYGEVGDEASAKQHWIHAERLATKPGIHTYVYKRTLAEIYCDQDKRLEEALTLARQELKQRPDLGGHDLVAWVLYKLGRFKEAAVESEKSLVMGINEPSFYYHAALIQHRCGNNDKAISYLKRIKSIADYLLPEDGLELLAKLEQESK